MVVSRKDMMKRVARFKQLEGMNVTRGPKSKQSVLMFIIGGNAPSSEFTNDSTRRIEFAGALPRQSSRAGRRR